MNLNLQHTLLRGFNIDLQSNNLSLYLGGGNLTEPTAFIFPKCHSIVINGEVPEFESLVLEYFVTKEGDDWQHSINTKNWELMWSSPTVSRESLCW